MNDANKDKDPERENAEREMKEALENQKEKKENKDRFSREEVNLCEFPFAALTTQRCFKALEFKDTIHPDGKEIQRSWIVDGSLKLGTPIAIDEEVLMILLSPPFIGDGYRIDDFTTYKFCRVAGWPIDGRYYKILQASLLRLAHATITTQNSFFDNKKKNVLLRKTFHILDELHLSGMDPTGDEELDRHIWHQNTNEVKLSAALLNSMSNGYVKPTDLDFYLDLQLPIARRLYRFLDHRFHSTGILQMRTATLGLEHIGLSRGYKPYHLKHKLNEGFQVLQASGYLKRFEHKDNGVTFIEKSHCGNLIAVPEILKVVRTHKELVQYFHGRAGIETKPNRLELKEARQLIKVHGLDLARFIVDYAVEDSMRSPTTIRVFGFVKLFEEKACRVFAARQALEEQKVKQQSKARQEELNLTCARRKSDDLMAKFNRLPPAQQSELRIQAEALARTQGSIVTKLSIEVELEKLMEQLG